MTHTRIPLDTPNGVSDLIARYRDELKEINQDRKMAARFDPATTITWLAELDHEESAVREALSRLARGVVTRPWTT
jgi:hypothetical protein